MVFKDTASCAAAGSLNIDGGLRRPSDDPEETFIRCYIKSQRYFEHKYFTPHPAPTLAPSSNNQTFPLLLQFWFMEFRICEDKEWW